MHEERSLCHDSCLNHPLCLPLGEPNQKSKGKGSLWSGVRSSASWRRADHGLVVEVKVAGRKNSTKETRTYEVTPVCSVLCYAGRHCDVCRPQICGHTGNLGALITALSDLPTLWGMVSRTCFLQNRHRRGHPEAQPELGQTASFDGTLTTSGEVRGFTFMGESRNSGPVTWLVEVGWPLTLAALCP